jgi:site-specific DNA-methyltransferase (adenine-specific)
MASRFPLAKTGKIPSPTALGALELVRRGDPECVLLAGDNLAALELLQKQPTRFALAYLDPPFLTGREHALVERKRGKQGQIVRTLKPAFDDRWDSLEHYLAALEPRIAAARELLLPEGCLVLHVDPKTRHYLKVACDRIFGRECFASEIIWRYRRWPSKTPNFQRVHDVLLRYVKDPRAQPRFQQLYEPLAASTLATWGTRKQRAVTDESGRRTRSSVTAEATPGAPLGDVWEIGIVAPVAKERTGYPTQKPEALMSRLIQSCTAPGDWVLDAYAGSGTTAAVARKLGRPVLSIDESARALQVARRRLKTAGFPAHELRLAERESETRGDGERAAKAPARVVA